MDGLSAILHQGEESEEERHCEKSPAHSSTNEQYSLDMF